MKPAPSWNGRRACCENCDLIEFAVLSELLPSGFEARLATFAKAIQGVLTEPSAATLAALEHAAGSALAHRLGGTPGSRNERVHMARRLARWLVGLTNDSGQRQSANLPPLAQGYARDAAYVDWARLKLLGGDELAALSAAYADLAQSIREQREAFNKRFAAALKAWNADLAISDDCLAGGGHSGPARWSRWRSNPRVCSWWSMA